MKVARIAGLVYIGTVAVLFSLQTRMIFPGAEHAGAAVRGSPARGRDRARALKTKRGERVVALYGARTASRRPARPQAAERPTMIFFYGNAMCLNYATAQLEEFRRLGVNVLIPEYVGYGMSSGRPSEKGCQATAAGGLRLSGSRRARCRPKQIIAAGWSLGGAVAIDLAFGAASRRLDRVLFVHERRRDGQAGVAVRSRLALAAAPIRQHPQDRQDHLPDPDRSRTLGPDSFRSRWAKSWPRRPAGRSPRSGSTAPTTTISSTWAAEQIDKRSRNSRDSRLKRR